MITFSVMFVSIYLIMTLVTYIAFFAGKALSLFIRLLLLLASLFWPFFIVFWLVRFIFQVIFID